MSDVDLKLILLIAFVVIAFVVIALIVVFRFRSRFKMSLKFGEMEAGFEGENKNTQPPETTAPEPVATKTPVHKSVSANGNVADAGGDGAVAIGGDAKQSVVVTGPHTTINLASENGGSDAPTPTHQLPPDLADFTGREDEAGALMARLSVPGGVAAISALAGLGGIGKSALAVHVAHRLVPNYPAGQLFLELGGTSDTPLPPADIMGRVIQSVHPTAQLPDDADAVTAMYRDLLTADKYLVVLDNARDAAQVEALLPPPPSAAIITSRQPIVLPNVEAHRLDVLSEDEARSLLGEIAGSERATEGDLDRIAAACGHLPLALRVAGTFLRLHATWTIDEYLSHLEGERTRLQALRVPDNSLDVAQTLGLSVVQLEKNDASLALNWRKLSVFAGGFDRRAVAAVWDCSDAEARDGLDVVLRRSMTLYDAASGRHRLHDLMRDVARLETQDGALENILLEASLRHAVHYRGVLAEADDLYLKGGDDVLAGLALYDLEEGNIKAGHDWAVAHAEHMEGAARLCYTYTAAGAYVLNLRLHPLENVAWLDSALTAARTIGDRRGEGNALGNLGNAWVRLGEVRKAIDYYEQALEIAREIGDRRNEGNALGNLGIAWKNLGEMHKAIDYHEQALAISREIGDRRAQGQDLGNLGNVWSALDEVQKAIAYYEQDLGITREIGDRRGEGSVLGNLGVAWLDLGEVQKAMEYCEQQLEIAREIGDPSGEGNALFNSAVALKSLGDAPEAMTRAQAALEIFTAIESPSAEAVRKRLDEWR